METETLYVSALTGLGVNALRARLLYEFFGSEACYRLVRQKVEALYPRGGVDRNHPKDGQPAQQVERAQPAASAIVRIARAGRLWPDGGGGMETRAVTTEVWTGNQNPNLFSPATTWVSQPPIDGKVQIDITAAQTTSLSHFVVAH